MTGRFLESLLDLSRLREPERILALFPSRVNPLLAPASLSIEPVRPDTGWALPIVGTDRQFGWAVVHDCSSLSGEARLLLPGICQALASLLERSAEWSSLASQGHLVNAVAVRRDETLSPAEERFRIAFDTAPDAIAISLLRTGLYLDVNEGFLALTGYTRAEVIGRSSHEIRIWADPGQRAALIEQLLATGHLSNVEVQYRRKDGTLVWTLCSARILELQDGPYLLTSAHDITGWRLAQDRIRFQSQLLDAVGQAVVATGPHEEILYWNKAAERLYGWTAGEAISRRKSELIPELESSPDDGDEFVLPGETRVRSKDGTPLTVMSSRSPICDANGERIGDVYISWDLSEAKRIEARLRESQRLSSIATLAAGIAHEFNNQMTVVLGYSEFLRSALADHPERTRAIDSIVEAAGRAATLTRQLLSFTSQQFLRPRPLNLNRLVSEAEAAVRRILPDNVALTLATHPGELWIEADSTRLLEALVEIAANGCEAMPEGGELAIRTSERLTADRRFAVVEIADRGCGMDAATRARMLEPCFTTKSRARHGGLGLSSAYGIVRQSGGELDVFSQPGQGTTVQIALPSPPGIDRPASG